MNILKLLYLNTFFFLAYAILFSPILLLLKEYMAIFTFFSIEVTGDIKSIFKLISFVVVIGVFALSYYATNLCNYFGVPVLTALWAPFTYVKELFTKSSDNT